MKHRTSSLVAIGTLGLALVLGGCGGDSGDSAAEEPTDPGTSSSAPETGETPTETDTDAGADAAIEITIEGDTVTPSGERRQAEVGEPVTLVVDSDAPGELHVHSTPEQELAYDAGTTTLELVIDQPGVVDVESHDLGLVIVQLEVR